MPTPSTATRLPLSDGAAPGVLRGGAHGLEDAVRREHRAVAGAAVLGRAAGDEAGLLGDDVHVLRRRCRRRRRCSSGRRATRRCGRTPAAAPRSCRGRVADDDGLAAAEVDAGAGGLVGHRRERASTSDERGVLAGVGVEAGAAEGGPEGRRVDGDDGAEPARAVLAEHDLLVPCVLEVVGAVEDAHGCPSVGAHAWSQAWRRVGVGVPRDPQASPRPARAGRLACDDDRVSVFAASLRVYEPLAAFEGAERLQLGALRRRRTHRPPAEALRGAQACAACAGRRRTPARASRSTPSSLEVDGVTLVCPWRTALRSQEALLDFCAELPDQVARRVRAGCAARAGRGRARPLAGRARQHDAATPGCRLAGPAAVVRPGRRRGAARSSSASRPTRRGPSSAAGRRGRWSTGRRCRGPAGALARALAVLRRTVDDDAVIAGRRGPRPLARGVPPALARRARLRRPGAPARRRRADRRTSRRGTWPTRWPRWRTATPYAAAAAYARVTARMKALQAVERPTEPDGVPLGTHV